MKNTKKLQYTKEDILKQYEEYIIYLQEYLDKINILDLDNEEYLSLEDYLKQGSNI